MGLIAPPNLTVSLPITPSIRAANGTLWDDLDIITFDASENGGLLQISLTNTGADGWIIADAIRVAAPGMLQVDSPIGAPVTTTVNDSRIEPLLDQAFDYFISLDASNAARLQGVEVYVRDLSPNVLGLGSFAAPQIWLDDNAAGHGWRLTPGGASAGATSTGQVDLLSVLTHELGHVLGYPDVDPLSSPGDLMAGRLAVGESRVPYGVLDSGLSTGANGLLPLTRTLAADRLFTLFESRDPLSSELTDSIEEKRDASPSLTAPAAAEVNDLQPLLDAHRRRRELLRGDNDVSDDFFSELGETDDTYEHRV